jgi:anhydro-N-acetylmuramic acid kinase
LRGIVSRPRQAGAGTGLFIGLNSGTSADRIDAILVSLSGGAGRFRADVRSTVSLSIPRKLRTAILAAPDGITVRDLCSLDADLGRLFGHAALRVLGTTRTKTPASRVRTIGLHGQTVCHRPGPRGRSVTLQIGLPEAVAAIAGIPVVSHFRQADTVAGGEGAPLSPALDRALFASDQGALVLNLGGIANLTAVSAHGGSTLGWDVGPGNMLLDGLVRFASDGRRHRDTGGRLARAGRADPILLAHAFDHPFLARRRARSTGREEFGGGFLEHFLAGPRARSMRIEDLLATAAEVTAEAAWRAFVRDVGDGAWGNRLWLCGGGVHNRAVVECLRDRFEPAGYSVRPLDRSGVTASNRECVLFAFLAREFVEGRTVDLTSVTGARTPVRLGRWTPVPE